MHYTDRIYGAFEIEEPVLLDLIQTRAMQRLHGVLQHGISGLLGITRATSRFEHSMGVMLLVRHLGAPLEEQIAALLHDVSHTAFSHVIDYVFDGHDSQSYHEEKKSEYVVKTDLPETLRRHGYGWEAFLDEENYPLLEQPSPALCADRLDYFLRDGYDLGLATLEQVQYAVKRLIVVDGRIAVSDLDTARWLGDTFMAGDKASWANFREVGVYELTAQAIKTALDLGVLHLDDLWGTDQSAWDLMQNSWDAGLRAQLALVSRDTQFVRDEHAPTFWVSTKLRTIDPPVLQDGRACPLSQLDPAFAGRRMAYITENSGKWPMRVIPPS